MLSYIKKWMSRIDEREINRIEKKVLKQIDRWYQSFQEKSDQELANYSMDLKEKVNTQSIDPELQFIAFALVKEAVRRVLGIVMHNVQLIGGWVMAEGKIAEMRTGEGKTIVSLLPAYWFALQGKGVHMITANEYLAQRDYEEMGRVFHFLHISVGLNHRDLSEISKKDAYEKEITYGTCSEFGFDYLRDHLALSPSQRVQRALSFVIVDEVDSILIDEARTPLVIAGKTKAAPDLYYVCSRFVKGLVEDRDYEVDLETKQAMFTEIGIKKIEATFMIDNLYDIENTSVYHYLLQSLRAKVLMRRDVEYMVADNEVKLIDAFTGRILEGRQFSEGLHQAIEAKEQVPLSDENRTHATITIQKFFSLYHQVVGMTGTIKTEEEEIQRIYGLEVVSIPTHKPVIRHDYEDIIFQTKDAKYRAIISEIKKHYQKGRPVLVGTTSILQSEEIARLLSEQNIPYQLLNAKTEKEEAEMIAKAGQKDMITIATNMAGRGTDIRLGEGVAELGGLHIIGTERHESRRIDDQLRGRAGRQGDPGSSQFFLSLDDDIIQRFAFDEAEVWREQWKWENEGTSEPRLRMFIEAVQKKVEQHMFEIRSMNFRLDSIIHEQRQTFYKQRDKILSQVEIEEILIHHVKSYFSQCAEKYCPKAKLPEEWDIEALLREIQLGQFFSITSKNLDSPKEVLHEILVNWDLIWNDYFPLHHTDQWKMVWNQVVIKTIDQYWIKHLEILDHLKQGIHYRSMENKDPIQVYQEEAWQLFERMGRKIEKAISQKLMKEIERFHRKSILKTG